MTIQITDALLANLRDKAKQASPGLWVWEKEGDGYAVYRTFASVPEARVAKIAESQFEWNDARFIAAANPVVILGLVTEIRLLQDSRDLLLKEYAALKARADARRNGKFTRKPVGFSLPRPWRLRRRRP